MQGTDKTLIGANAVLVAVSMCLTSFFGWTLGEGILWLAMVLAVAGATISFLAPLMGKYASLYATRGFYFPALMCGVVAAGFFIVDVLSNFGAAAAVRSMNVTAAQNVNNVANDARDEVKRLQAALTEVKTRAAWGRTDLETPESYLAKVQALKSKIDKRGRNLYKRSGSCGTDETGIVVTEPDSQALCQEIASLEAEHAMATDRRFLQKHAVELQQALTAAKGVAAETPTVASAAIAQVKMLSRFMTLNLEPGEAAKAWTDQGIVAAFSIAVSVGAFVTALVIGIRQGLPQEWRGPSGGARRSDYYDERYHRSGFVPDYRDRDQRDFDDAAARTRTPEEAARTADAAHNETVIISGAKAQSPINTDKFDDVIDRVNLALAKYANTKPVGT